jgi:hypothetical protein
MTSAQVLLALLLLAAEPAAPSAPPSPASFRSVLGPGLRPGAWGLVRVEMANGSSRPCALGLEQEVRGVAHAVRAAGEVAPGEKRSELLPFRPMPGASARADLVGREDARLVAVVGQLHLPAAAPGGFGFGQLDAAELPEYAAAYEGLNLLVLGEFDGSALTGAQRQALAAWLRAGGRVFVASARTRAELAGVLFGCAPPEKDADRWESWAKPLAGNAPQVASWTERGGSREPLVVRFRTGFGRGAMYWPAGAALSEEAVRAVWPMIEAPPQDPLVGPVDRRLYADFPPMSRSLGGAPAALRWALGAALLMAAAGAVCWRRAHPWRFAAAAAAAALAAAALAAVLARPGQGRALAVRIDEFSADNSGVRARELLYLERVGRSWSAEVEAARGALPAPVLYRWEEGGEFASRLELPAPGSPGGPRLTGLELRSGGLDALFVGAGPLPGTDLAGWTLARAGRSRYLGGLKRAAMVAAIADCLAPASSRWRAQAEALAEWVLGDLESRGLVGGKHSVTVRRLPDEPPALRAAGRVECERLGRLGIFLAD